MQISNKKVMILGGFGLVGRALTRQILEKKPAKLIITSLFEGEAKQACKDFEHYGIELQPVWGNLFVRDSLKDMSRSEIMENPQHRQTLLDDVMGVLTEDVLEHSYLYQIIAKYEPDIIIDSVNSATALAYQDVYTGYYQVKRQLDKWSAGELPGETLRAEMEKFLGTVYIPQLIRHIQILYEATRRHNVTSYIKVGTSGTGGMGLNIPYTHSEERPSRVLLSKTSLAGAHSLLLFLMGRTPDAPNVKEVKPATAIAWKGINFGEVMRRGKPIPLFDCKPENALKLSGTLTENQTAECNDLGENLKSVFIDTGENGIFSYGEFYTITSFGQMQFVTPEEISQKVITEIEGGNTGSDIIGALDGAVMGSTYRAGYMRQSAIDKMEELIEQNHEDSVAFENLGPPRLSKLLYEAYLLKMTCNNIAGVLAQTADKISEKLTTVINENSELRSKIISIGIPILMPDGRSLIRGPVVKIPVFKTTSELPVNDENIDEWTYNGWIDLRTSNMQKWIDRIKKINAALDEIDVDDTSSRYHHGLGFWKRDGELHIGKLVSWIFVEEEKGERVKD